MQAIWFLKMSHYVKLKVTGKHSERFFNLCRKRQYPIWDMTIENDCFEICMSAKDYEETVALQQRMDCHVQVLKRGGGLVFLKKYLKFLLIDMV